MAKISTQFPRSFHGSFHAPCAGSFHAPCVRRNFSHTGWLCSRTLPPSTPASGQTGASTGLPLPPAASYSIPAGARARPPMPPVPTRGFQLPPRRDFWFSWSGGCGGGLDLEVAALLWDDCPTQRLPVSGGARAALTRWVWSEVSFPWTDGFGGRLGLGVVSRLDKYWP